LSQFLPILYAFCDNSFYIFFNNVGKQYIDLCERNNLFDSGFFLCVAFKCNVPIFFCYKNKDKSNLLYIFCTMPRHGHMPIKIAIEKQPLGYLCVTNYVVSCCYEDMLFIYVWCFDCCLLMFSSTICFCRIEQ
jgi:hypothetical protein